MFDESVIHHEGQAAVMDYELIDFGEGRKLERFGDRVIDRLAPVAHSAQRLLHDEWEEADAAYALRSELPSKGSTPNACWNFELDGWPFDLSFGQLLLRTTPAGQVGVFPEQASNWHWVFRRIESMSDRLTDSPRVLNLFGYTGSMTLAASLAGARVTHVDASKSAVNWARDNARLSRLSDRPIRWIVEDARKYVSRELARKQSYHGIILDPPTYGHGPKNQAWQILDHLTPLLFECHQLLVQDCGFLILSHHCQELDERQTWDVLRQRIDQPRRIETDWSNLDLVANDGRRLYAGRVLRWAVAD